MKPTLFHRRPGTLAALAFATLAALLTPSARLHSQLAPLPADPGAAMQAIQQANTELLRRQEASLKDLEELTTIAREARIFARRG